VVLKPRADIIENGNMTSGEEEDSDDDEWDDVR
jgi:hypothetical protein